MKAVEMKKATAIFLAINAFVIFCNCVFADDMKLEINLEDMVIKQWGAITGTLKLTNVGNSTVKNVKDFSVLTRNIKFVLTKPDMSEISITGHPMFDYSPIEAVELDPGDFIIKPIILLRNYDEKFFFEEIGQYSLSAKYRYKIVDGENFVVKSESVLIEVVEGGKEENKYLELINRARFGVIDVFRESPFIPPLLESLGEFEDYQNEIAKIVIYQAGGGRVLKSIFRERKRDQEAIEIAQKYVGLAKRYGYGVEMWEYLLHKAQDPSEVRFGGNGRIYPKNEFYF